MTELKKIEELLEKYYQGNTSSEEENMLRRFFAEAEIPEHMAADAGLFRFFLNEKEALLSGEMEDKLGGLFPDSATVKASPGLRLRYYWISGAAAVILILLGLFLDRQIRQNSSLEVRMDTYEDPYLAYAEARRALYIVSKKMNAVREPLKNLGKLDAGVNYMHPVFSFGAGIRHLEHFSKIEETRKLISK